MSRGRQRFSERELSRVLRAAAKSGTPTQKVEIDREGRIIIILGPPCQDN